MSSRQKKFFIVLFMFQIRVMYVNSFRYKKMQIIVNKF